MASCEICGKNYDNLNRAIVEGVMINVCNNCVKFGKVIPVRKPLIEPTRAIFVQSRGSVEEIVTDYADIVRKAREKKGLKQEELASNISEKESIIHKIETGSMKPSFIVARKLEQFLGIKLIEIIKEQKKVSLNLKDNSLTIGDLLDMKNRKV